MKLRMPREKLEAIEKARADVRRARREVAYATERLRAAERDAVTDTTVHIAPEARRSGHGLVTRHTETPDIR